MSGSPRTGGERLRTPPILLIVMTAVTLPLALMFATASGKPMLFELRHLAVANPFRDHAPERVAERFLAQVRDGNRTILAPMVREEDRERILEREAKWPLRSWRLAHRKNERDGAWLLYMVRRGNGYGVGEMAVEVTARNGRVVNFGAIY